MLVFCRLALAGLMKLITLDFETYYDADYSLRRMSTEEYVRDPRFEVIGVSAKIGRGRTEWFTGDHKATLRFLRTLELPANAALCHHTAFDGLVLGEIFGIYPSMYMDTMLMANAEIKPFTGRVSLAKCLEWLNLQGETAGSKGDEVQKMMGRHRESLSKDEMIRYGQYCKNDADTTFTLFQYLVDEFPREELRIIDLTLRMYLQPTLELDGTLLAEHLQEVRAKKEAAQARVRSLVSAEDLSSTARFVEILKRLGVDVPMKRSPADPKRLIPAMAKNDLQFKEFAEEYEDDPAVGPLILARLATKSTLEETRTDRLLGMARRQWLLRVPLSYYAAHTGRYGGTEGSNLQNLPQPHKSKIRFGIRAPAGSVVLGADLSQIEARLAATVADERSLVNSFREGRDVYSEFGTRLYGRSITREDKRERFLSKTAVLGLQYGMGSAKFISAARALGDIKVTPSESAKIVDTYRTVYPAIPRYWRALDEILERMVNGGHGTFGCIEYSRFAIKLPNGMHLRYPNLEMGEDGYQYTYGGVIRNIWGGKLFENIIQALARNVVMENMLRIYNELGLRPALQVHDELDYVVLLSEVESATARIRSIMTAPPHWMAALPVDVEIHAGPTFGDCK